jgi:hypothetical protein
MKQSFKALMVATAAASIALFDAADAQLVCTAYSKEELGGNKWPTTDAKCAKCAEGYQWWPCDTDLCKCEESTDGTPEPEPTSVPTPQPTGAPVVRVRAVSTSSPTDAQCLNNNHFADGTFIIDQPGSYK